MKNTNKRFNLLIVQIKGPRTKIMFKVNIDTLVTSLLEKEKCPLTVYWLNAVQDALIIYVPLSLSYYSNIQNFN